MAFSLESPRFSIDVSDQVDVHQPDTGLLNSSGNSSTSGDSTRRSCLRCHGRMSSLSLDRHTFCYRCRGAECDFDNKCDECMSWTKEEMEAYVKLRKSLAGKSKHCKGSSKPPSPPRSTAPVVNIDIDDRVASQVSSLSKSVDEKLVSVSEGLFSKFITLLDQFKLEITNYSVSAEPGVSGRTPVPGQPAHMRFPVSATVCSQRFQGSVEGPMPTGSGYAHLSQVAYQSDRLGVGVGVAHSEDVQYAHEDAHPPQPSEGPRVSFAPSGSGNVCV